MYTQKDINDVLKIYDRLNSLRGTVRLLGYPSRPKLREWLRERRETGQVCVKSCLRVGWGAKSGLGNPGVQALGAHSEQLE